MNYGEHEEEQKTITYGDENKCENKNMNNHKTNIQDNIDE